MFYGEFDHSLDAKGRVILPAEIRELLGEKGFMTKVLDGCLAIYRPEEFQKVQAAMQEYGKGGREERHVARTFSAGTRPITPDKQGRVAIPPNLREFAELELEHEVKVIGNVNHVELWNTERWVEVDRLGSERMRESDPALDAVGI